MTPMPARMRKVVIPTGIGSTSTVSRGDTTRTTRSVLAEPEPVPPAAVSAAAPRLRDPRSDARPLVASVPLALRFALFGCARPKPT